MSEKSNLNALLIINKIVYNDIPIELNRTEKMVLLSLVNHNNWKTGLCNPSIKTIQNEWFYKSDREVIKALKSLSDKGIFTKETIKRRNYYHLNIEFLLRNYINDSDNSQKNKRDINPQNVGYPQNVGNLQNDSNIYPQNVGNDYPQNVGTNNERTMKEQLKNNIYSIFEHWNLKEIVKHKELNPAIEKAISKSLEIYSIDEIKQGIDNYNEILKSSYVFNHYWSLNEFLTRERGISTFIDNGINKLNYDTWRNRKVNKGNDNKVNSLRQANFTQRDYDFNNLEKQLLGWD
ncbi:helix-turn-helix domain-containing protein [Clostridium perfringens]|uniref:Phage protein n=1 Tax=Clostridium perfringens TaxID=1502 RepID=A0AAW9IQB9_CLOPF|nr:helix-turn-helix domain-containing protein [Clostridium perfringens]MBI6027313.1 helix-turn-helix domain-containing protein [Clostridium perfringens]MBI6071124.1 helix-turn-helix domain-containing protein [Clostridium perfringens]MBI6079095.1 helix-turn-helix domain-containing protein [Clostridium perfringens]MBI6084943.1 helix-turn-helix domain-containing protein [Clostridium perfringens]MBI6098683.1 helix-turn-helix domain-containing protein [Clostridium perfringens]